ncbi:MAG: hypothetical protein CM15mP84_09810 [Cellvibrionales bacterium]|nr:MAG: hypothetical protein CM15mP84_09810 [Cellvibrionales bacterium]
MDCRWPLHWSAAAGVCCADCDGERHVGRRCLGRYRAADTGAGVGWLLQPLAWALGIPWDEAQLAGSLIGQKFILNEFVAYVTYSEVAGQLSPHSQAIVIFALCGFANLSSIAILLGGLGAVAPGRRDDISRYGFRALMRPACPT